MWVVGANILNKCNDNIALKISTPYDKAMSPVANGLYYPAWDPVLFYLQY